MEPELKDEELYNTDMSVGEIFRRTRTHYGQSLQDIERALRIRASQIEAIETGNIEKLPGRVYAIGFVRSYAEYLGLNGDKMVRLFKIQVGGKAPKPQLHFPVSASESKIPKLWLVGASTLAALLIVVSWWSLSSRDRSVVTEIPPAPAVQIVQPPAETVPPAGTLPAPESVVAVPGSSLDPSVAVTPPAVPAPPKGIILNITENSWVEIKDKSGKSVVARVLEAGDQYYVPDRPDLFISLGNAGGVSIEIDGVRMKPLGGVGEVKRNIPLDTKFLKENYAGPEAKSAEKPAESSGEKLDLNPALKR